MTETKLVFTEKDIAEQQHELITTQLDSAFKKIDENSLYLLESSKSIWIDLGCADKDTTQSNNILWMLSEIRQCVLLDYERLTGLTANIRNNTDSSKVGTGKRIFQTFLAVIEASSLPPKFTELDIQQEIKKYQGTPSYNKANYYQFISLLYSFSLSHIDSIKEGYVKNNKAKNSLEKQLDDKQIESMQEIRKSLSDSAARLINQRYNSILEGASLGKIISGNMEALVENEFYSKKQFVKENSNSKWIEYQLKKEPPIMLLTLNQNESTSNKRNAELKAFHKQLGKLKGTLNKLLSQCLCIQKNLLEKHALVKNVSQKQGLSFWLIIISFFLSATLFYVIKYVKNGIPIEMIEAPVSLSNVHVGVGLYFVISIVILLFIYLFKNAYNRYGIYTNRKNSSDAIRAQLGLYDNTEEELQNGIVKERLGRVSTRIFATQFKLILFLILVIIPGISGVFGLIFTTPENIALTINSKTERGILLLERLSDSYIVKEISTQKISIINKRNVDCVEFAKNDNEALCNKFKAEKINAPKESRFIILNPASITEPQTQLTFKQDLHLQSRLFLSRSPINKPVLHLYFDDDASKKHILQESTKKNEDINPRTLFEALYVICDGNYPETSICPNKSAVERIVQVMKEVQNRCTTQEQKDKKVEFTLNGMYSTSLPKSWTVDTSSNINLQNFCSYVSQESYPRNSGTVLKATWLNKCVANTRTLLTNRLLTKAINKKGLNIENGKVLLLKNKTTELNKNLKKINDEPNGDYADKLGQLNRRVDITLSELGICDVHSFQETNI